MDSKSGEPGREPLDFNAFASVEPKEPDQPGPSLTVVITTGVVGLVVGMIVGYVVSVSVSLWFWPESNQGPLLFLFTLCPVITVVTPLIFLGVLVLVYRLGRELRQGKP